jgi:hypothetical protein
VRLGADHDEQPGGRDVFFLACGRIPQHQVLETTLSTAIANLGSHSHSNFVGGLDLFYQVGGHGLDQ